MEKTILFLAGLLLMSQSLFAQKNERTFIFGNSLINHEFQTIPTPSQETSVPYWFQELSETAGYDYAVGGQYGFLPQHANLPPISQWGFDNVAGAWESDYEPFSDANFTSIMITPGNFIQFQSPSENYPYENVSPLSTILEIFEWCEEQQPGLKFYIYENWPDMAGFLGNDFPPSTTEWQAYNTYLNGEFHDWFVEYSELVRGSVPDYCVRFIPVGTAISHLLQMSPYNQIPVTELYEDDAPHGRATTYFLAAIVSYMVMYEEKVTISTSQELDDIIHPIIRNNYSEVVDILWNFLNNDLDLVFPSRPGCELMTLSEEVISSHRQSTYPNPIEDVLYIEPDESILYYDIYTTDGRGIIRRIQSRTVNVSQLSSGQYFLIGFDSYGAGVYQEVIIKI